MIRYVVCTLVLAAVIAAMNGGLSWLSKNIDFWAFMLFCGAGTALIIAASFAYDRYERRSQQSRR